MRPPGPPPPPRLKKPSPPPAQPMTRAGRCAARCRSCGASTCRCEGYLFARSVAGWRECECGHTQDMHEPIAIDTSEGGKK